jgi:hypothetical protein
VEKMVAKSPVKLNFSFSSARPAARGDAARKGMTITFGVSGEGSGEVEGIKKVLQAIAS